MPCDDRQGSRRRPVLYHRGPGNLHRVVEQRPAQEPRDTNCIIARSSDPAGDLQRSEASRFFGGALPGLTAAGEVGERACGLPTRERAILPFCRTRSTTFSSALSGGRSSKLTLRSTPDRWPSARAHGVCVQAPRQVPNHQLDRPHQRRDQALDAVPCQDMQRGCVGSRRRRSLYHRRPPPGHHQPL